MSTFDAVLIVSFGGPEKPEDVIPFLENVLRGRNVPRDRMLDVAEHYYHFGGKSPINDQNRELIAALQKLLDAEGPHVPIYWGNRNWHPLLPDTIRQMRADGVKRAVAFFTSAFSSYSGCRQYRENVAAAQQQVGEGAPEIVKVRRFYNDPLFVEALTSRVRDAMTEFSGADVHLAFTAHSVPMAMASTSDYVPQLEEACAAVAHAAGLPDWKLVYQSRSGPPAQPWLEPDIGDHLRFAGKKNVIVMPIGFISDHMEVLYDLDTEVADLCRELGIHMVRARTIGTHPSFVRLIRQLIVERMEGDLRDLCAPDCCPAPAMRRP